VGTHVQQGDVIGYVGMTGLATGPHLHYEYLVNGVHKNPQTVQLPGAEPLRADTLEKFRHLTAPLLADLSTQQAASPGAAAPAGPLVTGPLTAGPPAAAAAAAAGPFADEPPATTVFSVSSVLNDSRSISSDYRSRISIN
jgi:hypothetical protein